MTQITIAANDAVDQYAVGSTPTTGPFTISYPYFNENDIKVYVDGVLKTITTHYTISGTAVDDGFSGGTVTFVSNISNVTLTLNRDVPIARESDFPTSGIFNIGTLNTTLDKAYAILQQINTIISRAISRPSTSPETYSLVWPDGFDTTERTVKVTTSGGIEVGPSIADVSNAQTYATNAANSASAAAADLVITNADVVSAGVSETNAAASAASAAASAAGIYWKAPVLVSSTANLTLSGAQTIDGISAVAGDRVLVKDQTAPAENGIYIVAAGAWSRAVPMDTWDEHVGAVVLVSQGSLGENKAYQCTVNAGGTLGTTAITWASFGAVAIDFVVDTFVDVTDYTSGTTTALTLSAEAGSEQNITVTFDGVTQHHNQFSLSGTTLTFTEAIPLGVDSVEVKLGSSLGIGTPSDGTVTEAKIDAGAVTEAKIATSAVTVTKIADDAITLAKMAGGTDGNLITYDASGDPAYVATGTVGQVLTSGGAGVAPTMQDAAGGRELLVETSFTSQTLVTLDGYFGSHNMIEIHAFDLTTGVGAAGEVNLEWEVKVGGAFVSTNYGWQRWMFGSASTGASGSTNDTSGIATLMRGTGSVCYMQLPRPDQTDDYKTLFCKGFRDDTNLYGDITVGQYRGGTGAVTGIRFGVDTSNFSGTIQIWGS